MNDEKKRKLAELDRVSREQDEQFRRYETEAAGQRLLGELRIRLIKFGVIDPDCPDKAAGGWHFDEKTGEMRAWFVVDGVVAYAEYQDAIYVEHKVDRPGSEVAEDDETPALAGASRCG